MNFLQFYLIFKLILRNSTKIAYNLGNIRCQIFQTFGINYEKVHKKRVQFKIFYYYK